MPMLRGAQGAYRDEIRQPLYDTIDIVAAESPVKSRVFFRDIAGKSLALTNLRTSQQLERAVSFRMTGLAIDAQNYFPLNVLCLPLIMENSSLRLRVGEKDYWEGPMDFAAGRIDAEFGTTTADTVIYQKFGAPCIQPVMLAGAEAIPLPSLQSFRALWEVDALTGADLTAATPATATHLRFRMSLKGLLRRPVQ